MTNLSTFVMKKFVWSITAFVCIALLLLFYLLYGLHNSSGWHVHIHILLFAPILWIMILESMINKFIIDIGWGFPEELFDTWVYVLIVILYYFLVFRIFLRVKSNRTFVRYVAGCMLTLIIALHVYSAFIIDDFLAGYF